MHNFSALFIKRPVATFLISVAIMLTGFLSYKLMPVEPIPKMEFPAITISASLSGASAEIMASNVAGVLERAMGSIAGIDEITSSSSAGSSRIILLFDLNKDINEAAREVQAAINATQSLMPSGMKNLPSYRKINPSSSPIMILALTSNKHDSSKMYERASNILLPRISQVNGVGDVSLGGASMPAVRITVEPKMLEHYQISLETVRSAISSLHISQPNGVIEQKFKQYQISINDNIKSAKDYQDVILKQENNSIVRLKDVAKIVDDVESRYNAGFFNNQNAVLLVITKQANANILQTIADLKSNLPVLENLLDDGMKLNLVMDRSAVISATLDEAIIALVLAGILVVLVVILFLGNLKAAFIPCLAVIVSILGSFSIMYLMGFSLNIMSLMALIVATGLVVDDAIVVLENIVRHIEEGKKPFEAAILGSKEMSFTLLSINLSLVSMFISILFSGGIVTRFFKEFAITMAIATTISLFVAITLTPMMCAKYLNHNEIQNKSAFSKLVDKANDAMISFYSFTLTFALRFKFITLLSFFAVLYLNFYLFQALPKTMIPAQDTGQLSGFIRGENGLSFKILQPKMEVYKNALLKDEAVDTVAGFIGGSSGGNAFMIVRLKSISERKISSTQVANRIRMTLPSLSGSRFFVMPDSDIRFGGRQGGTSENELVLVSDNLEALRKWLQIVRENLQDVAQITDVDATETGTMQLQLNINKEQAKRYNVELSDVAGVLNNSFSQRQIATITDDINQYPVIMEINRKYAQYPEDLNDVLVANKNGQMVPITNFTTLTTSIQKGRIQHTGQFATENINFSLAENVAIDEALQAVNAKVQELTMPTEIQTQLGGTASTFEKTASGQPAMVLLVIVLVYIILGVLYESYLHPITILSTLPSAGVGALFALKITGLEFSLIALLGLYLLVGIVKKNAILMIDSALQMQEMGKNSFEAIFESCLLRFRPILMTTMAAILGAIPLVISNTEGAEMRQPLGVAIVGGLVLSQILTLYTTPVIYLYFDKLKSLLVHKRTQEFNKLNTLITN